MDDWNVEPLDISMQHLFIEGENGFDILLCLAS